MSDSRSSGGSGWIVGAIVFVGALMLLLLAFVVLGDRNAPPETTEIEPISGAVLMPESTALGTPSAEPDTAGPATDTDAAAETQAETLQPGQRAAAVSSNGAGTRVYGDSRLDALVLDMYQDGAAFEILAPGAEVSTYPLERDGRTWYRVRASDGLVGWVTADRLVPLEE
jgi:hypothetical protein